ncbi:MAG: ABC transporter substrate-binding protein [bacterium]
MKQMHKWVVSLFLILIIIMLGGCKKEKRQPLGTIKIGYSAEDILQLPIIEALKRSDAAEEYLVNTVITPTSIAKLSDPSSVNAVLLPLTTAIEVLDKDDGWFIAGKLVNNRVMLYSPLDAAINSVGELDEKRVAISSGDQAHRMLLEALEEADYSVGTDVRLSNLTSEKLLELAEKRDRGVWGDYDAFASSSPELVPYEIRRQVHYIKLGELPSLILVSRKFSQQHPEIVEQFIAALMESYLFVAHNFGAAVGWAKQSLPLDIDSTVVWRMGIMEPNFRAMLKGHINLNLPAHQITNMQRAADFMHEKELISSKVSIPQFIDLSFLRRGEVIFWENRGYEPTLLALEP